MLKHRFTLSLCATLIAGSASVLTFAQDVGDPAGEQPSRSAGPALSPSQMLGLRSRTLQNILPTLDMVVLVPDQATFLQALALWSPQQRFPILIETDASRRDVARFIHAFQPEKVMRMAAAERLEPAGKQRRAAIVEAVMQSWDCADAEALIALWQEQNFIPPGAVVTSDTHPAWVAAAALAAGRGQLIIWSDLPRRSVNGGINDEQFGALVSAIVGGLQQSGYAWQGLGDAIDALTICLDVPGRVPVPNEKAALALTDVFGRDSNGTRFAYTGWIFAQTPADAAYRAMCALFLNPHTAFLFDGYEAGSPWDAYSVAPAAQQLGKAGIETRMTGAPQGGFDAWQTRTRGGLGAELVHVNSSGRAPDFELAGKTKGWARDVPPLRMPAAVHFIHSWSATSAGDPNTIAGRWLAQGAFAYVGSVHEPYLTAFLTPDEWVGRLLAGEPWGAAPRRSDERPWKVQVIGDPLFTIAPSPPRHAAKELEGDFTDVRDQLRKHVKDGDLAEAVTDLVLLGRAGDAAGLLRSALAEKDVADMEEIAWAGLGAVYRAGDGDLFRRTFERLSAPDERQSNSARYRWARDLLWSKLGTPIGSASDADLSLLAGNLREKRPDLDAARVAQELARRGRSAEARALIIDMVPRAPNQQTRDRLQKALQRLGP